MPKGRGPSIETIPADRMRDLRSEAKLTVAELSNRSHVPESTISYMEKHKRGTYHKLEAIARALGNALNKSFSIEDMSYSGTRAKEARAEAKGMPPVKAGVTYLYPHVEEEETTSEPAAAAIEIATPSEHEIRPALTGTVVQTESETATARTIEIGERLHSVVSRALDLLEAVVTTPM